VDLYGHPAPEGKKSAVDKLDSVEFDTAERTLYAPKKKAPKKIRRL